MPAWFHRSASASTTATLTGFAMTLIGLDEGCRGSSPLELCRDHPPSSLAHRPEIGVAARPKAPNAPSRLGDTGFDDRSEEHTSELQSLTNLVCRLLLEKKNAHSVRINIFHAH